MISIIIPVYNLQEYLFRVFKSIIKQTNKHFEVLFINDGSTDKSSDLISRFINENSNIDIKLFSITNHGVSYARNFGLSMASHKYVLFLDGDDFISNNLIHIISSHIQDNADILVYKYVEVDEQIQIENDDYVTNYEVSKIFGDQVITDVIITKKIKIWTGSAVYNKNFLLEKNIKFSEDCKYGEDTEFQLKAITQVSLLVFIPVVLSYYLQRQSSVMKSVNIRVFDSFLSKLRVIKFYQTYVCKTKYIASQIIAIDTLVELSGWHYLYYKKMLVQGYKFSKIRRDIISMYPNLYKEAKILIKKTPFIQKIKFHIVINHVKFYFIYRLLKNGKGL